MKKIIFAIAAVLTLSSCAGFLDRNPLNKLSPETYFETETQLQLFSNTFYTSILDAEPYDHQSDLIFNSGQLSNELMGGNRRTVPASGGGWTWTVLRKINTMLDRIDNCEDVSARNEYAGLARFFRAYFYFEKVKRFGDVPWYEHEMGSDDPDLYKPRDSREIVMQNVIADLDTAIKYLPTAVTTFRVNKWAALALKSRVCLYEGTYRKYHNLTFPEIADAKDYEFYLNECVKASEELMNGKKYKLYSTGNPTKDYIDLFKAIDANTDEYILAIKYDEGLALGHDRTFKFNRRGDLTMSKKAVDMYLMADGSRFTDIAGWETKQFVEQVTGRDPRLAQTIVTPGYVRLGNSSGLKYPKIDFAATGYHPIKFVIDYGDALKNDPVAYTEKSWNDLPVFRYAEVLLNYAEAKAELGTLTQDDIDKSIKLIRDRVGMPNLDMAAANVTPCKYLMSSEYGYRNVTGANKGVILEIRREREVEMMDEGTTRWDDLMRWKEGKCVDQDMVGIYFPGAGEYDLNNDGTKEYCFWIGSKPSTSAEVVFEINKDIYLTDGTKGYLVPNQNSHVFDESRDYLYPIPTDDRALNPNLAQNPGWDDGLNL